MLDTTFRTASQEPETTPYEPEKVELTDAGNRDKAVSERPDLSTESELDKWEIQNGKYGLEYLGIKEIAKEFPYNADFSILDNYIKESLQERGYDKTPGRWQEVLNEIENEIGSKDLNAIERLKRLTQYVKVAKKINDLKKQKESFRSISPGERL